MWHRSRPSATGDAGRYLCVRKGLAPASLPEIASNQPGFYPLCGLARAGVSGVRIAKIQADYSLGACSLGASKWQIMRHVIIPNSLPEIFTGARVAMGVCWGTVVAAELVAAQKGAGMMIIAASKFQLTDIVVMGIILIGVIGYGIDILMRMAEKKLVPWKGRA